MPICNQLRGDLPPLNSGAPCCDYVARKSYYQFEYVSETELRVNDVYCNVIIGEHWVELKRAIGQPCFGDITIHRSQYDAIINELKEGHPVVTVEFYG